MCFIGQLWALPQLKQLLHNARAYRCVWKRHNHAVFGVLFDLHYIYVVGHARSTRLS